VLASEDKESSAVATLRVDEIPRENPRSISWILRWSEDASGIILSG